MNKLLIIGIIILTIILLTFGWKMVKSKNDPGIESYPYKVISKDDKVEIRQYEPALFTSVKLSGNEYSEESSNGFRVLAGYIFGDNAENEKIAMTSPVSMSLEDSMEMMFMVPAEYKKEDLPVPTDKNIKFIEQPAKVMAAISFGGWSNDDKIEKYQKELTNHLDEINIKYTDRFYFYGYNAPYEVINRRNEVLVELPESYSKS